MQLAGRLRATTLGDLLGVLHRGAVTGMLEFGTDQGRTHRVHLAHGLVTAVEIDGASPSLGEILRERRAADEDVLRRSLLRAMASQRLHGEVLIDDFRLSPAVVGDALRRQVKGRLSVIDTLADARVSFRVAVRPPRGALGGLAIGSASASWDAPLTARDFLAGRRRARARTHGAANASANAHARRAPPARPASSAPEDDAWTTLGLAPGAELADVKRAYRRLARTVHPDLHPEATAAERRALEVRFMQITRAYDALAAEVV
jgi:hypothetical protein